MPGKTLADRLPGPFPRYDRDSDFEDWLEAHQDELDQLDQDVEDVKRSLQIAHATGQSLDLIGSDFGLLGKRRGRDDASYRQYLMSLVQAFDGRGTPPGVRTAVAAGVLSAPNDIELLEDFQANTYEVRLTEWVAHRTGALHTLAELADPVAIQRQDPLQYLLGEAIVVATASSTSAREVSGQYDFHAADAFDGDGSFGGGDSDDTRGSRTFATAAVTAAVEPAASTEIEASGFGASAFGAGGDEDVQGGTELPAAETVATASPTSSAETETDGMGSSAFGAGSFDGTPDDEDVRGETQLPAASTVATAAAAASTETEASGFGSGSFDGGGDFSG